jgi:ABC-type nitrate/sulfonate/bicarbonate transport system substrate-binding protein
LQTELDKALLARNEGVPMKAEIFRPLAGALLLALVTEPSAAKEKLSIALNIDPSHAAMTYAIRTGKVSSDLVELDMHFLDVNAMTQAASSRRFDILQLSALAVPRAIIQGLGMKILGISSNGPPGSGRDIWVKKDSPLEKPEDLKGKTLGVYSLATGSVTLVRIALWKHYGFNVSATDGDFTMKQMQMAAMPAALATGQVDASMLANIQAYQSAKSGDFRSLISTDKINIGLFGTRPIAAVFIGYDDKLATQREAYRAAMIMLRDSRNYARSHPDEVYPTVAAAENIDEHFLRIWEDEYQGFPVSINDKDVVALDKLWGWSKELGILPETVPAAEAIWDGAPRD